MQRSNQRGFTIIEVMIALTLMAFILAILFAGFRLASTTWDAAESSADAAARAGAAQGFLRRLIAQSIPLPWRASPTRAIAFKGDSKSLHFIAALPMYLDAGGLRQIHLSIETDGKQKNLVLRVAPLPQPMAGFTDTPNQKTIRLIEKATEIELAYFGAYEAEPDPAWRESWLDPKKIPQLVRLRVTPNNAPPWSDIIAAPLLTTVEDCIWDSFYKRVICPEPR
jgi:general secretion pathway protein J